MARELIILTRFKRDYRTARKHPEFDAETLEYVFDLMIAGVKLPEAFHEHGLAKREANLAGLTECQLGADLLLIYRVRRNSIALHRIGRLCAIRKDSTECYPEKPKTWAAIRL